jgi:hypothetical protein
MARLLEVHAASEERQWLGMRKWMENRQRKWDAPLKNDVVWGTGITDMATKILPGARASERQLESENGLQLSKYASTT